MKVKLIGAVAIIAAVAVLALTVGMHATPAKAAAQPAAAAANAAGPEKHAEIRAALGALHNAKEHLEHAAHDFGGHRVDAIRAIDEAQRQLEICLKY